MKLHLCRVFWTEVNPYLQKGLEFTLILISALVSSIVKVINFKYSALLKEIFPVAQKSTTCQVFQVWAGRGGGASLLGGLEYTMILISVLVPALSSHYFCLYCIINGNLPWAQGFATLIGDLGGGAGPGQDWGLTSYRSHLTPGPQPQKSFKWYFSQPQCFFPLIVWYMQN